MGCIAPGEDAMRKLVSWLLWAVSGGNNWDADS
jgi:hypothetical protein